MKVTDERCPSAKIMRDIKRALPVERKQTRNKCWLYVHTERYVELCSKLHSPVLLRCEIWLQRHHPPVKRDKTHFFECNRGLKQDVICCSSVSFPNFRSGRTGNGCSPRLISSPRQCLLTDPGSYRASFIVMRTLCCHFTWAAARASRPAASLWPWDTLDGRHYDA